MEMEDLILLGSVLSFKVKVNEEYYRFGVEWTTPESAYDDVWKLKSYCNIKTGKQDLKEEEIKLVMRKINPRWNWNSGDCRFY